MTDRINRAFLFALYAHGEQRRKDGLPYIVHPFEVGMTLARNGADEALVCAGLLHDTIEDAYITPEQLREVLGDLVVDKAVVSQIDPKEVVRAPGMKYKHYAPKGDVIILKGTAEAAAAYAHAHAGPGTAVLCYEEELPLYRDMTAEAYGRRDDLDSLAHGLFAALRDMDEAGYATIFARCPEEGGVGYAVRNRLNKAAGFHIQEV